MPTIEIINHRGNCCSQFEIDSAEWYRIDYVDYIEIDANNIISKSFHDHKLSAIDWMQVYVYESLAADKIRCKHNREQYTRIVCKNTLAYTAEDLANTGD